MNKIIRNTPTGVGKTKLGRFTKRLYVKHPHGRGEDDSKSTAHFWQAETPPRAWGRRPIDQAHTAGTGNTPTGVGKTTR